MNKSSHTILIRPSICTIPSYPQFLYISGSTSKDSSNRGSCSTIAFTIEKNPCISEPMQFKSMLVKGQQCICIFVHTFKYIYICEFKYFMIWFRSYVTLLPTKIQKCVNISKVLWENRLYISLVILMKFKANAIYYFIIYYDYILMMCIAAVIHYRHKQNIL